jgi:hypothetical protein
MVKLFYLLSLFVQPAGRTTQRPALVRHGGLATLVALVVRRQGCVIVADKITTDKIRADKIPVDIIQGLAPVVRRGRIAT